jgi:hypothetical protein
MIMADVNIVVNKVLYYIFNNVSNVPKNNLVHVLRGFYNAEEIVEAKQVLHKFGESLILTRCCPTSLNELLETTRGDIIARIYYHCGR